MRGDYGVARQGGVLGIDRAHGELNGRESEGFGKVRRGIVDVWIDMAGRIAMERSGK